VPLGAASVSLSVQDGSGIVYTVPAGNLPADGRVHQLTVGLSAAGQARYPLRLLAVSVSYQLPGFPAPPYPSKAAQVAATHIERRTAAARATLVIGGLAVSPRAAGGFPAPFARPSALARWNAAAGSTDFADVLHTSGIQPAVIRWGASAGAASLTFAVGSGHRIQQSGRPALPVAGQLALTAAPPAGPVPAIVTSAFLGSADAHLGDIVPLPVGNVTVPVRLVAQVRAFPGAVGTGPTVIVDQARLQAVLAAQSQPPLPVTQWWLRTSGGVPAGLPAGATVVSRAGLAAALLGDPLPNVPQMGLLLIVAVATGLACIGFAVSVVATIRERRLTDALLAALGVGRSARAGQLCLEQLMLSLPAAVAGALIGLALAYLLVPAVTLTSGAAVPFPPARVVVPLGSLALLALTVAAVPVLAAAVAAAYRPDPAAQLRAGEPG
jgi:hypothetical protein